jgi:ribonucleoside-triphosphate reductase
MEKGIEDMDISQSILSDIVVWNKYAKFDKSVGRRESWEELCDRNMSMHINKFPHMTSEILEVYKNFVIPKKVLPSMRSMQFAGRPIELSNSRIFNCSFSNADHPAIFWETMFNLLSGSGVGYSVQERHISQLPVIVGPQSKNRRFLVGDSIEGWADAVKVLVRAYAEGKSNPVFDFRDIRPKGAALITSGGKAPGPDPLRICIEKIRSVLNTSVGRKLLPLEIHDILCHIADAVLSGGIRRAAMIVLFDKDDQNMLYCKSGSWWELNPQRGRANNSVLLKRGAVTKEEFEKIWEVVKNSGAGEPGIIWTNDLDSGQNPCVEIGLRSNQMCNLTETDVSDVETQTELEQRVVAGAFLGTLQASYTDFHYLRDIWKLNSEEEALIGVGMTGIGSGKVLSLDLKAAAECVLTENERVAKLIGINKAARTTCIKPSGSTSCVVGSSSGIHAWHAPYYIRRMRIGNTEAIHSYLKNVVPELIEPCVFKPHLESVLSIPQKAPLGAIMRSESALELLSRVGKFNTEWVLSGHRSGIQNHNVSSTISIKESEWYPVRDWMWDNQTSYTGISVLPYDGHTYQQSPFEDCTEEEYEKMYSSLKDVDLSMVFELDDNTALNDQAACGGGNCEVK